MERTKINQKKFLASTLGGLGLSAFLLARGGPAVKNSGSTDGDERFEPNWDELLTITVGRANADLVGGDDKAIQAAIDYLVRLGSGTVQLLPGTYTRRNAIHFPSRIRLRGSGEVGSLFRNDDRGKDFWPNRNLIEKNRVVNSGEENGVALDIQGKTSDLRIVANDIRELRAPMKRTGIRTSEKAARIALDDNRIEGFSVAIADQRTQKE